MDNAAAAASIYGDIGRGYQDLKGLTNGKLKRQVKAANDDTGGGSKAFINDQPVGVALLRELSGQLVELHGHAADPVAACRQIVAEMAHA